MACNGLHYGILSNYNDTYFLKREEASPTTLYVTRVVQPDDLNPTLRECVYYISRIALMDNIGNRVGRVVSDNYSSSNDDDSDDDNDSLGNNYDNNSRKRKRSSKGTSSSKKVAATSSKVVATSSKVAATPSKGITTIDEYIGGGSFGKVFSGYYHGQAVAWKTCDAYKEKEKKEMLRVEANLYSILKECQGHAIPRLFYEGYVYDGYLYALALQLIEDARHIDPATLTIEEKETIVKQLQSIHSYGVLYNDIAQRNILFEPKSRHFFFVDLGLSEIVGTESLKLRKEEKRFKKLLQL